MRSNDFPFSPAHLGQTLMKMMTWVRGVMFENVVRLPNDGPERT